MSPQTAIDAVTQMTDELGETYSTQAELVLAEVDIAREMVGDFKQWKCTNGWWCHFGNATWESQPNRFTRTMHVGGISPVPHSRQGEAMEALVDAEETYDETDEEQVGRHEKLSTFPTDIGGFLTGWFGSHTEFSDIYYPASVIEVPASGQGWLSSNATTYGSSLSSQRAAAEKARGVMEGLVTNTSSFLGDVTDSMANMVQLALDQEQLYLDLILAAMQEFPKISGFISMLKELAQVIQDERVLYFNRIAEIGRQLSTAVNTVVQVGLLANNLRGIGPGGQWPSGTNAESDPSSSGQASIDQIRGDVQWFKGHVDYWDAMAADMTALRDTAAAVPKLPNILIDLPQFSAHGSLAMNNLADDLVDVVNGGRTAAENMSEALTQTIKNYLANETSSAAQADQLFNEYFDD